MTRYDLTGITYSHTRRPDPRIAADISRALAGAESVVNVGAGSGSYEPAFSFPSHVVVDGRLVTGQNPGSAKATARKPVSALD
jgi:putative intracellular protease/amidase